MRLPPPQLVLVGIAFASAVACASGSGTPATTTTAPAATATATAAKAAPAPTTAPATKVSGRPNLLVLIGDDIGVDKIGAYAADYPGYAQEARYLPSTPTIDGLAASGLRFSTAWANPVCSPTRATIQTGRYGFRTGVGTTVPLGPGLRTDEVTIAKLLGGGDVGSAKGPYVTGLFGKWHLGTEGLHGTTDWAADASGGTRTVADSPNPIRFGWGTYDGNLEGKIEDYRAWTRIQANGTGNSTVKTEHGYATDVTVDAASTWIQAQRSPWLAMVTFNAPHTSGDGRDYRSADLAEDCPASNPGEQASLFQGLLGCLDTRIGKLLTNIPKDQLANTVIVFMGDNGTESTVIEGRFASTGERRDNGKATSYETGIHVPLIVASGQNWLEYQACSPAQRSAGTCALTPGVVASPGRAVAAPVGSVDLFATLAELGGASPTTGTDSVSFKPCLTDPSPTCNAVKGKPRALYAEDFKYSRGTQLATAWLAYREGSDKLVAKVRGQAQCMAWELYSLDKDPTELQNLASSDPTRVASLQADLDALAIPWIQGLPTCTGAEAQQQRRPGGQGGPGGGQGRGPGGRFNGGGGGPHRPIRQ